MEKEKQQWLNTQNTQIKSYVVAHRALNKSASNIKVCLLTQNIVTNFLEAVKENKVTVQFWVQNDLWLDTEIPQFHITYQGTDGKCCVLQVHNWSVYGQPSPDRIIMSGYRDMSIYFNIVIPGYK